MELKICGIYKITSPNNKIYIGQSTNIMGRFNYYRNICCKSQQRLYNSIKKYGWEKHKLEIICQCDKTELNNLEVYYIELYQTFNSENGLNLRTGGNGNFNCSNETRKKMSILRKGKPSGKKGYKATEEQRKRISDAQKKRYKDHPEQKENMRNRNIGRKHSQETKDKHRNLMLGDKNPNYRKIFSQEIRNKIGAASKGRIVTDETKRKLSISGFKVWQKRKIN